jgi:hypothetical protein
MRNNRRKEWFPRQAKPLGGPLESDMRNLFLASAAALAIAYGGTAVLAQSATPAPDATNASNPSMPAANAGMTPTQKVTYDSWSADQKANYDKWPAEYQSYFWSLSANQQRGWMALTDAQRKQVYEMPPASRAAAWASIEHQMAGAAAPSSSALPSSAITSLPPDAAAAPPMDSDAASAPTQIQANPRGAGPATDTAPDPATADAPVAPAMPADPNYQAGPYKGALTAPPADAMNKTYPVCTRKLQDNCRNRGGI